MGKNTYLLGKQFGDNQIYTLFQIALGYRLISTLDLKTRKRSHVLRYGVESQRLRTREVNRMIFKGLIKTELVRLDKEYMVVQYSLTSVFQELFWREFKKSATRK